MLIKKRSGYGLLVFCLFLLLHMLEIDAAARLGGGRSMGSTGSRSFSAPSSPSSSPMGPTRQYNSSPSSPMNTPTQQPQSGGFMRSLAGGIAGGIIGGMLFRSLGLSGFGGMGGGGGFGIFEILLIGLILYGIWWYIKKKKLESEGPANNNYYQEPATNYPPPTSFSSAYDQPVQATDAATGIGYIRRMDPYFDEQKFTDQCMDIFFKLQGAWANRDMSTVRSLFTGEMYGIIQGDAEELKRSKKINHLDNIAVRSVELTEAWQESGNDFITVKFYANLLDYTTDETSGQVLSGSKIDPVKFVEFWTFTRPVGNNPWLLSAISQEL